MGKDEPQSYGSQNQWVKGDTGQKVNPQKTEPDPETAFFYEDRVGSETNRPHQGGDTSPSVLAENEEPGRGRIADDIEQPIRKVTDTDKGARREGYFQKRDYPR